MGSLRGMIARWGRTKAASNLLRGSSTMVGGNYIMMEDNPREYIEKGLTYNPDVASVIDYITRVALRVPWVAKKGDKVLEQHEIYELWENGNPITRGKRVWGTAIKQYLTVGNTFIRGIGPDGGVNAGRFREFYNLPYDMAIERGDSVNPIKGYKLPNKDVSYPIEEVLHWKTDNPDGDGYFGTSPLKAGRLVLQQSNDAYLANAKSLQNLGARGILTRKDLNHAGAEQAKKLKEEWKKEMAGADKFNKLTIAGGEYSYINFGLSPVDLQLLDAQLRSRQAICNIYSFPSELLNDKEASTYNNLQTMLWKLYTDVEIPLLEDLADEIHRWWISKYDDITFRPDWSAVEALQKNRKELTDYLSAAWWIPAERKSEIMGEEPTVTGHYIPMNLIPDTIDNITYDDAAKEYNVEKHREK